MIIRYHRLLGLLGILLVPVAGCRIPHPETALPPTPATVDLHGYMTALADWGFSGAVQVERAGRVLLQEGYGHPDLDGRLAVTPHTILDIGSLSKQFTAAAILLLCDRGSLRVDDSLGAILDGVPPDKRAITIHQLLTHSAGIPREIGRDFEEIEQQTFVDRAFGAALLFPPGTGWSYSNAGYALLATVVAQVSGMPFHEFLEREVFPRAGLVETGFIGRSPDRTRTAAALTGSLAGQNPSDWPHTWNHQGSGGMLSTVADLARWWHAIREGRVISPARVLAMFTPYVHGYGYGVEVETGSYGLAYGHTGLWYSFTSNLLEVPDSATLLIALSNGRAGPYQPASVAVTGLAEELFGASPERPPALAPDAAPPSDLAGRYRTVAGGEILVRALDNTLRLGGTGQDVFDAVFSDAQPTVPVTRMLRNRTVAILMGIPAGEFDTLAIAAPRERYERYRRILPPIWQQRADSLGPLQRVTVSGIVDRGEALDALATLWFARGNEGVMLTWSREGQLLALENENPSIDDGLTTFRKTRRGDWAAYHYQTRRVVRLRFERDGLVVSDEAGHPRLHASRAGNE